jgi:Flp pilus assembly protein TadG
VRRRSVLRTERGAAVVDIVLVMVVLVPVVLGIIQVALVLHVHNTMASAASEGARLAATRDRGPADGAALTRSQIGEAISGRFARDVSARQTVVDGVPGVEVTVHARVPALGIGGPGIELTVTGHAVEESP